MTLQAQERRRRRNMEGFTLVELLVVLAIIGLIAAIATPQVLRYLGAAKVDTTKAQIRNVQSALELYYIDSGRYPSTEEGLVALETQPDSNSSWNGPYLKKGGTLKDAWGNAYKYESPAGDKQFQITSFGRDGREGGESQDADLRSE
ncbi:type II secretion system major pseudopilin GspG [Ensifer sp. ENS05]|uniref:type II secretion system major pseudopilin GspG n=1 Tax=Ensifer sp. ENS05 TaxID=2769277 RepID=UPI00177BE65B|nr:type II secretion system major pseudopilin GspG [Ensifer sp. ENS05]MBD9597785.1 type II secretion system major pseudopilin GspG [Ensifer sp. ENS05]